jgi:hypothetical protein
LKALEKCRHGCSPRSDREHNDCDIFAATFVEVYFRESDRDIDTMYNEVMATTEKKFPGVWKNEKKLELIKSFCLSRGAENILEGAIDMAQYDAFTWSN